MKKSAIEKLTAAKKFVDEHYSDNTVWSDDDRRLAIGSFLSGASWIEDALKSWNEVLSDDKKWDGASNPYVKSLPPYSQRVLVRYTIRDDIFKKVHIGIGEHISPYLVKVDGFSLQESHKLSIKAWKEIV